MDTKEQIKDRDEALLSLDKENIIEHCKLDNISIPDDEIEFWAGVHYCVFGIRSATEEQRQNSRQWISEHGFSS